MKNKFLTQLSNRTANRQREINNKGFIEIIVVIIVALVLLNLMGIDLKAVLAKESVKQFFTYVKDMIILVWSDFKLIVDFIRNMANN